jgi:hypothetical protein
MCVRKKPVNLTLSDDIKARANRIMQRDGFSTFSSFVEHLIREEYNRLSDAGKIPAPSLAPALPVATAKATLLNSHTKPKAKPSKAA